MARLVGRPHAKLGESQRSCDNNMPKVPDVCENCRQVDRWMARTVSWTNAAASRFKSILETILRGHDEILKALCGFCGAQNTQTCDCFVVEYTLLGLPLSVQIEASIDSCLSIKKELTFTDACVGGDLCLLEHCTNLCAYCDVLELDPCNNPEHLEVMIRAVAASKIGFGKRPTGDNILTVIAALFPDTVPVIQHVNTGIIYVDIGREFTAVELQFLKYFAALIPVGFGVEVRFVSLC